MGTSVSPWLWALLDGLPLEARSQVAAVAVDGTSGTVLIVDGDTGEPLCAPMLVGTSKTLSLCRSPPSEPPSVVFNGFL
jgi:hypothetical protein